MTQVLTGEGSFQKATHMARYGHRDWIWWIGKDGQPRATRKTPETVKAMLLETGTQGKWALVSANNGCPMRGFWGMGLNILAMMKYGF